MNIDFLPSASITLSLIAVVVLPVSLVLLSHGPWKIKPPGQRFIFSAAISSGCWFTLMFTSRSAIWVDVFAGGLLLATAMLAGFTIWTLVAWGFTLSMLLTLAREGRPLSEPEWIQGYTGGKPNEMFSRDRLGVLIRFGMASENGNHVVMTPGRGRRLAQFVGILRRIFGLAQ